MKPKRKWFFLFLHVHRGKLTTQNEEMRGGACYETAMAEILYPGSDEIA